MLLSQVIALDIEAAWPTSRELLSARRAGRAARFRTRSETGVSSLRACGRWSSRQHWVAIYRIRAKVQRHVAAVADRLAGPHSRYWKGRLLARCRSPGWKDHLQSFCWSGLVYRITISRTRTETRVVGSDTARRVWPDRIEKPSPTGLEPAAGV